MPDLLPTPSTAAAARPLLTIAIPTFNRAPFLDELLHAIAPQLPATGAIELIVSDNASSDETAATLAAWQARGLSLQILRNQENLGPDANFLRCVEAAAGKYVWILGDDDIILPGALPDLLRLLAYGERTADFDLVYLSSIGFAGPFQQPAPASLEDALGRYAEIVTDGAYFLEKVNALIGLISVIIFNRERLLATPHPPIAELNDSNLLQVGWIFPLLHRRCRVLYIWQRLLAYRSFNSGGWGVCRVFGLQLGQIARRYFAAEPALARALMNGVLRYWMCDSVMSMRLGREQNMEAEEASQMLRPDFGRNWRFWMFVSPVATLPLPAARAVYAVLRPVNRATRAAQAVLRHVVRRGQELSPGSLPSGADSEAPR